VLLTVPVSPVGGGAFSDHVSEQNGPFVQWNPDASSLTLATFPPGGSFHICARGPSDAGPHNFVANFYAGIELFDSCGVERYLYRPGETVTVRVTGGVTFFAEQPRLQIGGGSPGSCGFPPFDTTTINTSTDPFVYNLVLPSSPADIPAYCTPGTTQVTGTWTVVTYDVPGCGCNRNTLTFQVQTDAPVPSCTFDCPADVEQTAPADSCGANVNFTPPAGGPGETINCDHAPDSFFPVGTTTVTCTGSPGRECSFDVTVKDATPPSVTPPANIETGTDDGTCDASLNPGTANAADACGVNVQGVRGDGQPLDAPYPKGTTTINWTATDPSGNTATAQQTVTVVDDEPPSISAVSASPSVLWPPNHSMQDVSVVWAVTDNCGPVDCSITSVTSNEPADGTGDGDAAPDFEIVDPSFLVRLRAERAGTGSGRVYNVNVTCTDGTNASSSSATVTVPKSQKN